MREPKIFKKKSFFPSVPQQIQDDGGEDGPQVGAGRRDISSTPSGDVEMTERNAENKWVPVDLTAAADASLGLSFDTYDGGPPEMNEEDVECEVIEEEEEPKVIE